MSLVFALALAFCPSPQAAPLAEFTASPTAGRAPLRVAFADHSRGGSSSWQWSFGDGSSASARNPVHEYQRPGRYTVTLTVTSALGADSERKSDFVVVAPDRAEHFGRPNVVLVVLDDVGVDRLGLYGETPPGHRPPCTPSLDALAAEGVVFTRAYGDPLCSPTRAQILTGRHGFRTGIGALVRPNAKGPGLSAAHELALPELLLGYDSSALGKWHLADAVQDGLRHPLDTGFRYFAGTMFNPGAPPVDFGEGALDCSPAGTLGYYNWVKTWTPAASAWPEQTCSTTYLTTDTADEAIARARSMTWPWFLQVNFNATHLPAQLPPASLAPPEAPCGRGHDQSSADRGLAVHDAVLEALDTELGRTLAGVRAVDPDAWILVISDNGTDPKVARGWKGSCFGPNRSKGTLYEGGIRVPLIVAGPGAVPGRCDALVSAVDLYATIAELALVPSSAEDSVSLVPYLRGRMQPLRTTVYSEFFTPNFVSPEPQEFLPRRHQRVIRNESYKLFRYTDSDGSVDELFFDLRKDPCERVDLAPGPGPCDVEELTPEEALNYLALQGELVQMGVY